MFSSGVHGLLVAFVGPDGAGKSTLVREVNAALSTMGVRSSTICLGGYLDPLLPTTRILALRARRRRSESSAEQNQAPVRISWLQELTLLNYILEFFAKYVLVLRPMLRQYDVLLADRYGYDFIIIPRRLTRMGWFNRLVSRVMPAPDLGYCVGDKASLLCGRKADNSLEETQRQLEALECLRRWVPTLGTLRSGDNLPDLVNAVVKDIMAARDKL